MHVALAAALHLPEDAGAAPTSGDLVADLRGGADRGAVEPPPADPDADAPAGAPLGRGRRLRHRLPRAALGAAEPPAASASSASSSRGCTPTRSTSAGRRGRCTSSRASPGDRFAVYTKIHHSLVDGYTGHAASSSAACRPTPTTASTRSSSASQAAAPGRARARSTRSATSRRSCAASPSSVGHDAVGAKALVETQLRPRPHLDQARSRATRRRLDPQLAGRAVAPVRDPGVRPGPAARDRHGARRHPQRRAHGDLRRRPAAVARRPGGAARAPAHRVRPGQRAAPRRARAAATPSARPWCRWRPTSRTRSPGCAAITASVAGGEGADARDERGCRDGLQRTAARPGRRSRWPGR